MTETVYFKIFEYLGDGENSEPREFSTLEEAKAASVTYGKHGTNPVSRNIVGYSRGPGGTQDRCTGFECCQSGEQVNTGAWEVLSRTPEDPCV